MDVPKNSVWGEHISTHPTPQPLIETSKLLAGSKSGHQFQTSDYHVRQSKSLDVLTSLPSIVKSYLDDILTSLHHCAHAPQPYVPATVTGKRLVCGVREPLNPGTPHTQQPPSPNRECEDRPRLRYAAFGNSRYVKGLCRGRVRQEADG